MKTIILAAGCGTRLGYYTVDKPKCMVEVKGKAIIDRQIEVLRKGGIKESEIVVVAGYRHEILKLHFVGTGIKVVTNLKFEDTNMVYSLSCAMESLSDEEKIIISYGDIIYNQEVLSMLLNSDEDISVCIDDTWKEYWEQRSADPLSDAETLRIGKEDNIVEVGQIPESLDEIQGQYIGLMQFKGDGIRRLTDILRIAEKGTENERFLWRTKRNFSSMYMTDLLQGLIDCGNKVMATHVRRGWFEFDCPRDIEVAEVFLEGKNETW